MENSQDKSVSYLNRAVTRRQAIKAGGITVVGLAFSKPLIETIYPKPAFASYTKLNGCTPGFWQGGRGSQLWDVVNDADWAAEHHSGGDAFNPFVHTTQFNSFFSGSIISALDGKTMLDLVGTGGGSFWPQKTARDVVAAYLNAAFGFPYSMSKSQIVSLWYDAVNEYNSAIPNPTTKLQQLHTQLDGLNNNGDCLG